jgi:diguanylate cyclase (GGDEF)-like protein
MEKTENLPVIGSQEMRILAKGYNEALRDNAADNLILQHEAEHDALTGLFNRGAFEKMKVYLSDSLEPIALLLIDVDLFKHVNDNYGHEIGDAALKKVANLLKEKFRASDMAFRVGGDEFCIIMTKVTPNEKNVIKDKITSVNEALAKPDEAVPLKLSLSVGIAFEQLGFNEELYSKADKALYYTKEHGRCGFTFYSSHAEM